MKLIQILSSLGLLDPFLGFLSFIVVDFERFRVRRNRRKSVIGTLNPSSTVAIIANVIENETTETNGPFTFDAEDLSSESERYKN